MVTRRRVQTRPKRARASSAFFARVDALVRTIPYGHVVTYGQIAQALGAPRGARTVGWALRACDDEIPWHRVVNAAGGISRRPTGGPRRQRALLEAEGVQFDGAGQIDLGRFGWRGI